MVKKVLTSSNISILLICLIAFLSARSLNYNKEGYQKLIKSDGKGYYAYLPAIFIYGDLNFGHFEPIEIEQYPETEIYDYRYKLDRQRIYNKYYAGTSILMAPFFLVTHGVSKAMGWKSDGYANHYHIGISLAAIFYLGIALFFMGKILDFYAIKNGVKIFSFVLIVFGTNWFYYVINEPSLSHVYSAAVIPFFIWLFLRFKENSTLKRALGLGLTLGLIALIRPINGLIVAALPMFFVFPSSFVQFIKEKVLKLSIVLPIVLGFFAVIVIQLIIYKIQTNQFFLYSYVGEHLNLAKPNISNFLFSYKKGLFVYTPILWASVIGLFYWMKRNLYQPIYLFSFLLLLIYVQSSWHMWWYGGGFGTRVMIEYYILWLIPIAYLIDHLRSSWRRLAIIPMCLLIVFSLFQTWQYYNGVIHWELMDKQKYWDTITGLFDPFY